ncbi:MAG: hypothetical protein ACJ74W_14830 [Pyrinomonadaceae bacterium]
MKADQKIIGMFQEVMELASRLMQTKTLGGGEAGYIGHARVTNPTYEKVSPELAIEWGLRCLNLLKRVFSAESDYYQAFKERSSNFGRSANYDHVMQALSILKAAKADYESGHLFDTRILLQAEVFDDFLEQAEHLLRNGYYGPAAIVLAAY